MNQIRLGISEIQINKMGMGVWSWGDNFYWGFNHGYDEKDIKDAFEFSYQSGIKFFDTAESYGRGKSEFFLGELSHNIKPPIVIATKFMPYPWRISGKDLTSALKASLRRLRIDQVDLYQIHWPFPPISIETWSNSLADAIESGMAKAVGVSNYDVHQMRIAISTLIKRDKMLTANQVEYNLINRKIEFNGLFDFCKQQQVSLIAYSPLAQGLLTGKYSPENPPPGIRGVRYGRHLLEKIEPLLKLMLEIGRNHNGKTSAQVALNWVICKGAIPIPGAKNGKQALENAGALGWELSQEEISLLDQESLKIQ